jgi:hypothetical protein
MNRVNGPEPSAKPKKDTGDKRQETREKGKKAGEEPKLPEN